MNSGSNSRGEYFALSREKFSGINSKKILNLGKKYLGENSNSNFTQGNKIISGKKTEVYDFFPMKHILQKFSNTFYERCEDPQIFIVIN